MAEKLGIFYITLAAAITLQFVEKDLPFVWVKPTYIFFYLVASFFLVLKIYKMLEVRNAKREVVVEFFNKLPSYSERAVSVKFGVAPDIEWVASARDTKYNPLLWANSSDEFINSFDLNRPICVKCGGFIIAELVKGKVVLRCSPCKVMHVTRDLHENMNDAFNALKSEMLKLWNNRRSR